MTKITTYGKSISSYRNYVFKSKVGLQLGKRKYAHLRTFDWELEIRKANAFATVLWKEGFTVWLCGYAVVTYINCKEQNPLSLTNECLLLFVKVMPSTNITELVEFVDFLPSQMCSIM